MRIVHNSDKVKEFSEIMLKKYYTKSVGGRKGFHRSDAIACPLKAYWRMTGEIEQVYGTRDVGTLLLGTLAHIALHENFEYQEKVYDLHGVYITVDAIYGKYPIETKSCYDNQTEILTENGWKLFKDLKKGEKVLTMNPDTGRAFFVKPLELVKNKYKRKLFRYETRALDIAVTPNHQMLLKRTSWIRKKSQLIECKRKIGKNTWFAIPRQFKWDGNDNIKTYMNLPLNFWLQFLGWYIAEGSIGERKYYNKKEEKWVSFSSVIITQKSKKYHTNIENILNKLGFHWTFSGDKYHISDGALAEYLKEICYEGTDIKRKTVYCCYNKKVPNFVKNLSPEKIALFLDEYWKGDGSYNGYYGNRVFYTSSKRLADDIHELLFKIGKSGTMRKRRNQLSTLQGRIVKSKRQGYIISEYKRNKNAWINFSHGSLEDYNGYVYCAIVEPYHTLFVRRNGKAYWCGNTRRKIYKKEDLPQAWIEQLCIAMAVMQVNKGYLMVMNIITFGLTVWEITMTNEERQMFLNSCIWQILSIINSLEEKDPSILTPKYEDCHFCSYRPVRSRPKGCPYYKKLSKK